MKVLTILLIGVIFVACATVVNSARLQDTVEYQQKENHALQSEINRLHGTMDYLREVVLWYKDKYPEAKPLPTHIEVKFE